MRGTVASEPGVERAARRAADASEELRRGLVLITALLATAGAAATYLAPLPAESRASTAYGVLFGALGVFQIAAAVLTLVHPRRRWLMTAALGGLAVVALWLAAAVGALPDPDPWQPVSSVVGFADIVVVALESLAVALLVTLTVMGPRPRRSLPARLLVDLAAAPLAVVVIAGVSLGVAAASDGFTGAGFPADTVLPSRVSPGERNTMEYCRPRGTPLAMDLYTPPDSARAGDRAPVVLYVHGGGMVLGDRKLTGLGSGLANHDGALFTGVRQRLNEQGIAVAAIDYRLPPSTAWPAQIEDVKCAVRFLRAHAETLNVDGARIGAWGSSAGATLASLLGLAGAEAGFDVGQYSQQSSKVQAVVDMFSPTDLTDLSDSAPFMRAAARIALGDTQRVRKATSPLTYVRAGAPPFLILHGLDDHDVRPRHSARLAEALRAAGVSVSFIPVHGAGHALNSSGQQPSPEKLTETIASFLTTSLAGAHANSGSQPGNRAQS